MWQTMRLKHRADADFVASASALAESTARAFVLTTLAASVILWALAISTIWRTGPPDLPLLLLLASGVSLLTLYLLPRCFLLSQALWLAGNAITITLLAHVLQRPEVAVACIVLPVAAAITVGWLGGLVAEGMLVGHVLWLVHASSLPPLPPSLGTGIIVVGAIAAALSCYGAHALLQVVRWSLMSVRHSQNEIEAARAQRLELKQVQTDLNLANRELARLSDRLVIMNQAAMEARQAKEQFVANVSHELRTPLNMIIGFSELMLQSSEIYGTRLPPALLSDIAAIERNSQHLARLVDDVLDLSQAEAARTTLSKEWVSLQDLVEEAIESVRVLYQSKGLYLRVKAAPALAPVFCDRTRVRQVIINLLSNAGRFTNQGGVEVSVAYMGDDMVVSVADTGPGIAPEDQARIFEPFTQLERSVRSQLGGSGLGLAISRRFVEMHGGRMWLESTLDRGSTFSFSLPLVADAAGVADGAAGVRRAIDPYSEFEYRQRTRRFAAPVPEAVSRYMVVDETKTLASQLERYFENLETVVASDVQQAVEDLGRSPAQALVVNTPTPADVPAELARLGDLPYGTPAMACWVPDPKPEARFGVVRYLVKPVSGQTLRQALEELGGGIGTVLLVDDNWEALQLFSRVLEAPPHRCRVFLARNGGQALDIMRARKPDLVLLDLVMPGMDGFGVLQQKAQDTELRDIPVIVISARDPLGEPLVSDTLVVTRKGGLSVRDLAACMEAISRVLVASPQPPGQGPRESAPA